MLVDKIRKKALNRATSPEHLDAMLTVAPPLGWLAAAVLVIGVTALLFWSVVSTAPVKVSADGILLTDGEILAVLSPGDGVLRELPVAVGQHVAQGDVLVRVSNTKSEDAIEGARIAVQRSERNLDESTEANNKLITAFKQEFANEKSEYAAYSTDAKALIARRQKAVDEEASLRAQGLSTNTSVREAESALDKAREAQDTAKSDYSSKQARYWSNINSAEAAIRTDKLTLQKARETLDDLVKQYEKVSVVTAQHAGIVVESIGKRGDYIAANQRLIELLPTSATAQDDLPLLAVLYVSSEGAARLQPGYDVEVTPSSVQLERDGYIRGKIVSVAATPTTKARMISRLENEALVTMLTGKGPVSEVIVSLQREPTTFSGLAWSTRNGPSFQIKPGTTAKASFVVDRRRIASFFFPRIDDILPAISIETKDSHAEMAKL